MLSIPHEAQDLDAIFDALANSHRRAIIYSLGHHPASIGQLAEQQNLSLPAIHRHIKVLEEAGLIQRKKSGRTNFLALSRSKLVMMQDWIAQYNAYWGSDEETLENYVASIENSLTT